MKPILRPTSIIILSVFLLGKINAQTPTTTDFFEQIKNYDLSTVLTADSILAEDREGGKKTLKRSETLGFIGDNYQRFFIHFISVIQNPTNPYEYLAYGKTMVKETVCSFQGTITIKQAKIHESEDIPTYKQGSATCDVALYEDKKQPSTGFIKGKLVSDFVIDDKGQFRYDGVLLWVSDSFSNNQFIGNWTSYTTNKTKKCHWGDYRIPKCGDLDIGAGFFSVNEKYVKNGWISYMAPFGIVAPSDAPTASKKKWWK